MQSNTSQDFFNSKSFGALLSALAIGALLIVLAWLAGSFVSRATAQNYQMDPASTEGQGNLVALRLVWGEKKAKLFVVGKKAAELDLAKDAKILKITAFDKTGKQEELRFSPGEGYYTIENLPQWESPYSLSVKTTVKGKDKDIKLDVKQKPKN